MLPLLLTLLSCQKVTAGPGEVLLTTRDGVDLIADWHPSSVNARPSMLLLHMIPPENDRSNWPDDFVQRFRDLSWNVLVLDRRGAGESGGDPEDAYEGEAGRYDVEAGALFLEAEGAGDLYVVGASNGTTSLLDYAAWAPDADLPPLAGAGFMTGGDYTELNTPMDRLPTMPAVLTYSTLESGWSMDQAGLDPGTWSLLEYLDGDHGTLMFEAAPEVSDDLVGFFAPLGDSKQR